MTNLYFDDMMSSLVFPKSTWDFHVPNAVLMQASGSRNYAFLCGKTGLIVYFYYLWSRRNNPMYKRYADRYVEEMADNLFSEMPLGFDRGITGVGWAVDHLIKHGFIEADANEVLADIDDRVREIFCSSSELPVSDLLSVTAYCVQRLQGQPEREGLRSLLAAAFVRLLPFADVVAETAPPDSFDVLWPFPWMLYCLGKGVELGVEEPLLRESLGRYRPRTEELLSGTVEPCVGRMLYLLASEIYPGLPCPGFSEADLPADISVHHGAGGVLLLMKIWGKGKIGPSEYASVATYIREFIPEYPYYLGLSVMEGRIALLDGTLGPALALEL